LEEMLEVAVEGGAVFDGTTRRRTPVEFTAALRETVERGAARMHELHRHSLTPPPVYTPACGKCSMQEVCQPKALTKWPSVEMYMASALEGAARE
jgi:CRISPR-associated exonuclease Cas4